MDSAIRIESVFEERICTTCGQFAIDQYSDIIDCFIKYKGKLIPFIEIIRTVLNFQPAHETCSMKICESCKVKLIDFYNFRQKFEEIRNFQYEILDSDDVSEDKNQVCSLYEIVKDFIKEFSIEELDIRKESGELVISSKSKNLLEKDSEEISLEAKEAEDENLEIIDSKFQVNSILEETTESIDNLPIQDKGSEIITEYLDDYLEEPNEEITIDQDQIFLEESIHELPEIQHNDHTIDSDSTISKKNSSRLRNPDQWACNKRKKLRNLGKTYINSKGKLVQGRRMLPSCGPNCRNRCDCKLSETDRQLNFQHYWDLGDVIKQREFINDHISIRQPARRKVEQSNRTLTLLFYLNVYKDKEDQGMTQVCKKMFKNTLAVSNQVIQGVARKYSHTGFKDTRGKHKRNLTESQQLAKQHVEKFSHLYLERSMTKIQLYQMYVKECREKHIEAVKESYYRETFEKFSNIEKVYIECQKCDEYLKGDDHKKTEMEKEYDFHLKTNVECKKLKEKLMKLKKKRRIDVNYSDFDDI